MSFSMFRQWNVCHQSKICVEIAISDTMKLLYFSQLSLVFWNTLHDHSGKVLRKTNLIL